MDSTPPQQRASTTDPAADRLMPSVYDELRRVAASYFRARPAAETLQPTALVHEAYLKLADRASGEYESRAHFMAVAATAMRHILVDTRAVAGAPSAAAVSRQSR